MKKILLVVDVQKGFITTSETAQIQKNIENLIDKKIFDCVIATIYQNYPNSPIIKLIGWDKLQTNEEQQLLGIVDSSDYKVKKTTYSSVNETLLDVLKQANDGTMPETIYVVGVDTECCVLSTGIDLFELGIRPIILANYCGSSSGLKYHKAGLTSLENLVGKCNISYEIVKDKNSLDEIYNKSLSQVKLANDLGTPNEKIVVDMLIKKGYHISFAESCTGGLACGKLVSVADASKVLNASVVTYANEAKVKYLGVKNDSIKSEGVVSELVAYEMACGVAKNNNAEVGVGITGIAGPTGETKNKPIGMVCFGFYINGKTTTYTKQFGNIGRNNVRDKSVEFVFDTLTELLK